MVVDAMNYIKGSRYQMYLSAREMSVRICTVSCVRSTAGGGELMAVAS